MIDESPNQNGGKKLEKNYDYTLYARSKSCPNWNQGRNNSAKEIAFVVIILGFSVYIIVLVCVYCKSYRDL